MAIGLLLALLLNQPLRARGLLRTMYFLPVVTPFVVVAIIWKWIYNGDFGLFNYYLLKTHLIQQPLLWLSDQNLAMPAVIMMSVWAGVGFSMVIYLAAPAGHPGGAVRGRPGRRRRGAVPAALRDPAAAAPDHAVPAGDRHHRLVPGLHPDLHHDQRRAGGKDDDDRLLHLPGGVQVLRDGLRQHAGLRAAGHPARLHHLPAADLPGGERDCPTCPGRRPRMPTEAVLDGRRHPTAPPAAPVRLVLAGVRDPGARRRSCSSPRSPG